MRKAVSRRGVHLIAAAAMMLISYDAMRPPSDRPTILLPGIWAAIYMFSASVALWFFMTGSLRSLQLMTAVIAFVGLGRGLIFFLTDLRLTPLGLNVMIICYAYLAHLYERTKSDGAS